MELVPVRMHIPQVLKAEWIWEIVAKHSGEEKESEVKRGVKSITGTWLIFINVFCFVVMEKEKLHCIEENEGGEHVEGASPSRTVKVVGPLAGGAGGSRQGPLRTGPNQMGSDIT
jgi:hypothetical protein